MFLIRRCSMRGQIRAANVVQPHTSCPASIGLLFGQEFWDPVGTMICDCAVERSVPSPAHDKQAIHDGMSSIQARDQFSSCCTRGSRSSLRWSHQVPRRRVGNRCALELGKPRRHRLGYAIQCRTKQGYFLILSSSHIRARCSHESFLLAMIPSSVDTYAELN